MNTPTTNSASSTTTSHLNPLDGRWITRDPIAEKGGWNLHLFLRNACWIYVDALGLKLTEQNFVDCFFVKASILKHGFWGFYEEPWEKDVVQRRKGSTRFTLKITGYWRTQAKTKMTNGKYCPCSKVRKAYEKDYPFSVTVRAYDIDSRGKEHLRYREPHMLTRITLLGNFHEQEITLETVGVSQRAPRSIVAPGVVDYTLDPKMYKAIRIEIDVLKQVIYNEILNFSN